MIGYTVYDTHHGENIKITAYDFFTHGHHLNGIQYITPSSKPSLGKDLEPIPLTKEILEKNGLGSDYEDYFTEDKHYNLEISVVEDEIRWTINQNEYSIVRLQYVHELQHALKLCGINKEIEL